MTSIGPFPMNGDPVRTDCDENKYYPSSSSSSPQSDHPANIQSQLPPHIQLASHSMVQQDKTTLANEQSPVYRNDQVDDFPDISPHDQDTYLRVPPHHPHMAVGPDGKDHNLSIATNTAVAYPERNGYGYTEYKPRSRSGTASSGASPRYAF